MGCSLVGEDEGMKLVGDKEGFIFGRQNLGIALWLRVDSGVKECGGGKGAVNI